MTHVAEKEFKDIVSHAKEYGFVFPSSEIYDGLQAVYDYGQNGVELKNNLKQAWWKAMTQLHDNIVGIDSSIFMHPTIWKASGHVYSFNDPMIDNKDSKKRYRADNLIEGKIEELELLGIKEINEFLEPYGHQLDLDFLIKNFSIDLIVETFERLLFNNAQSEYVKVHNVDPLAELFRGVMDSNSNPQNVKEFILKKLYEISSFKKAVDLRKSFNKVMEQNDLEGLKNLIDLNNITCPVSGTANWTEVRQFNLMFSTQVGSVAEESSTLYLRPETAQGIFVNFLNVQKTGRMKVPFGIAQIGKAFRNEIVARQFTFRMREFEQMEMQFFVRPGTELDWYEKWKETRLRFHKALGIPESDLRYHVHEKLAHYANAAVDIEYRFPFGFKEMEGIHSRTDFDLKSHQEFSKKKQQYFDNDLNADGKPYGNYIPYVVETSVGADRLFLAVLCNAYTYEKVEDGEQTKERTYLNLHPALAPYKVAVCPIVKKDGLGELGQKIYRELKGEFMATYDEKDSIGKRYTRQDLIGTPYCVAVDYQSLEDGTVTIRHRNTTEQERVTMEQLKDMLRKTTSLSTILEKI